MNSRNDFFKGIALFALLAVFAGRASALDIGPMTWNTARPDWINVKTDPNLTTHAVGDGTTDDTAALNGALSYLQNHTSTKSAVYFPSGTYKITSTLVLTQTSGCSILGCGSSTIIRWAGSTGGAMFAPDGCSVMHYIGLTWDGASIAGCAYEHYSTPVPPNNPVYETEIRHENESFKNFTQIGTYTHAGSNTPGTAIIEGLTPPMGAVNGITADSLVYNCAFSNCTIGMTIAAYTTQNLMWLVDSCEFENCGTGFTGGNGYDYIIANTHFQGSTVTDIGGNNGGGSNRVRHCTSSGSARFMYNVQGQNILQDCWVDGWTSTDSAVNFSGKGPHQVFDCTFTNPPAGAQRVLDNYGYVALSNNYAPNFPGGYAGLTNKSDSMQGALQIIQPGLRFDGVTSATETFLKTSLPADGSNIINVMAAPYNAKNDLSADATSAIQSAISAAQSANNGSIVYIPPGLYKISSTLTATGSNYAIQGSGANSKLLWFGATNGTALSITTPQNLAVEEILIEGPDATLNGIQETSTGPSSIIYDDVSYYMYNSGNYGASGFNTGGPGIVLSNLPAGSTVYMPHDDSPMTVQNCGAAQIYSKFMQYGELKVSGTGAKTGFLGSLVAEAGNYTGLGGYTLTINDNQDFVLGDYYTEQSANDLELVRGGGTGTGHVTIQGLNCEATGTQTQITVNNYLGRLLYGPQPFGNNGGNSPVQITQTGTNAIDLLLPQVIYFDGPPTISTTSANVVRSQNYDYNNNVLLSDVPNPITGADLASMALGMDPLRQLEAIDMSVQYGVSVDAPPVAAYAFENDVTDMTGSNNGTNYGASFSIGAVGLSAAQFNGSSSYVQIPKSVTGSFSISMWLQTSDTGGTGQWYYGKGLVDGEVNGVTTDFGTALNGGKFSVGVGQPDTTLTSTTAVNDGKWHHVVGTWNSTTGAMQVFVDGVLNNSQTGGPTGTRSAPPNLRIGSIQTGQTAGFYNGLIDQVQIYNYVVSATDVANLYHHTLASNPLVGYWKLDETSGTTLVDSSPAGENATRGTTGVASSTTVPPSVAFTDPGSMLFTGGGIISVGTTTALPNFSTPRTLSAWAKTSSLTGAHCIAGLGSTAGGQSFYIMQSDANLVLGANNGDDIYVPNFWVDTNWHHITATFDGTTAKVYADGTLVSSVARNWSTALPNLFTIGYLLSINYVWSGNIDDVRIYNRALTATEVAGLATGSTPGLVGYWKLNESASPSVDSSYSGNNGTWQNSPTFSATQPSVQNAVSNPGSLSFNGTNQYVSMATSAPLPSGTAARSICGWAKSASTAAGYRWIAAFGSPNADAAMFIGMNGTTLVGGGYEDDLQVTNFWDGNWHFIALTYDGTTAKLYADGTLVSSGAKSWNLVAGSCYIGEQVNNASEYWNGQVNNVRIYNRVLSQTEITSLAAGNP